jgi:hypothetical protein
MAMDCKHIIDFTADTALILLQFILEGLVPVVMSLFIWKLLPDNPETASFLTKHEKEYIINRLALETGSGRGRVTNSDKIRLHHVLAALKEYKIWGAWVMFWANTIGVYGYAIPLLNTNTKVLMRTQFYGHRTDRHRRAWV